MKLSWASILALVLAVGDASAQSLDQKVTYAGRAETMARAVAGLAKAGSANLKVSQAVAKEIVLVSVAGANLKTVLDRLADVSSCKWESGSDGSLTLVKDVSRQNREVQEERARRLEEVKKQITKLLDSIDPKKKEDGGESFTIPGFAMRGGSAKAQEFLVRIVGKIDPATIAGLDDDQRVVFSTRPTRMQQALPAACTPFLSSLIAEHNKASAADKERRAKDVGAVKTPDQLQAEQFMRMMGIGQEMQVVENPAKSLLVISRGVTSGMGFFGTGSLTASLRIYSQRGRVLYNGTVPIDVGEGMRAITALAGAANNPGPAPQGKKIEFSKLTKEFASLTNMRQFATSMERKVSDELNTAMLDPDENDPLSYVHGEALTAIAAEKGENLIACLPDQLVTGIGAIMAPETTTTSSYVEQLKSNDAVKLASADGWMTVRPTRPSVSRATRLNREALKVFLRAAKSRLLPSLDDYAAYATQCAPPSSTPIAMPFLMMFAPNTMQSGMMGMLNWDMLRFYGLLGRSQRDQLRAGGRIAFASFTPAQSSQLFKMTYGAAAKLKVRQGGGRPQDANPFMEMISSFMPSNPTDFRDEATEVVPNGLPPNGFLSLNQNAEPIALVAGNGAAEVRQFGALGPREFAMIKFFTDEMAKRGQGGQQMPRIEKGRIGERTRLEFVFRLSAETTIEETLPEDRIDANSEIVSLETLPGNFQRQVDRYLADMRRMPLPFLLGGRQAVPPQ